MKNIFLKDCMIKKPVTIGVDEPFEKVAELFQKYSIRHLPIINEHKELVGIISQRDLNQVASPKRTEEGTFVYDKTQLAKFILKQIMIKKVFTLKPDETILKAVELMAKRKLGCIPVIDDRKNVVGIICQIDILRIFLEKSKEWS